MHLRVAIVQHDGETGPGEYPDEPDGPGVQNGPDAWAGPVA